MFHCSFLYVPLLFYFQYLSFMANSFTANYLSDETAYRETAYVAKIFTAKIPKTIFQPCFPPPTNDISFWFILPQMSRYIYIFFFSFPILWFLKSFLNRIEAY